MIDHGTVESLQKLTVSWHLRTGCLEGAPKGVIGALHLLDTRAGRQVQAKPKIDHRPDDMNASLASFALEFFAGKFQPPMGIGLPEVGSFAQSIVVVLAFQEGLSRKYTFSSRPVAAMESQNKTAR